MPFIPHTPSERDEMLRAAGAENLDALFSSIPLPHRFPALNLPLPVSEQEILEELEFLSNANLQTRNTASFLGAGAYSHFIPSAVNHLLLRGEFYTAYTPYQPEISQGTLQAIFEYQSMIAALTGMDLSNASHYDGATAAAEAAILALNQVRGRKRIVLSPSLHPQYREVMRTYLQGFEVRFAGDELPETVSALQNRCKAKHLATCVDQTTALVVTQYPNFFGEVEELATLAELTHTAGALLAVVVNPTALALFQTPGSMGADIVIGEGQPLGIPLSYGGPYLGFFATRKSFLHKMSGRVAGETVDSEGRRGFVLTLSAREQHIKRERASSNICTNQGLMALAAAMYMSLMGKSGLRKVAEICFHRTQYAAEALGSIPGYRVISRAPFFHEFILRCPRSIAEINAELLDEHEILGGYDLGTEYPCLTNHMLLAFTEMTTRKQIDRLAAALKGMAL